MAEIQSNKKVLAFGTFDGIHPGHLHFLRSATKLGELYISVASDKNVLQLKNKQPSQNQKVRKQKIEMLGIAHQVIIGDTVQNNWSVIKKIKPDIIVLGYDQKELEKALKDIQKQYGFMIKKVGSYMPKKYHSSIINTEKKCVYCTLPEIQNRKITQNKLAWAFPTNIPIVPGHILISPKRCVAKFEDMTKKEIEAVFDLLSGLKKSLERTFKTDGFNFAWNEGKLAGQSVPHFHLHVLPRKDGDTGITKYEPREFLYRPGDREPTPEEELLKVARIIRNNIK